MTHFAAARRPIVTVATAGAVAACLLTAGCSSSKPATQHSSADASTHAAAASPPSSQASSAGSTTAATTIVIKNFGYTVSGAAVKGAMVKVSNNDAEAHTVTADTGKAFSVTIEPGKTETFKAPATAGSYKFHCNYHSNMHGTLVVNN